YRDSMGAARRTNTAGVDPAGSAHGDADRRGSAVTHAARGGPAHRLGDRADWTHGRIVVSAAHGRRLADGRVGAGAHRTWPVRADAGAARLPAAAGDERRSSRDRGLAAVA